MTTETHQQWKALLDDPEVEVIVRKVYSGTGRRFYRSDPLALDDLESWLWDEAVRIADSYEGPPDNAWDPDRHWWSVLHIRLTNAILQGRHLRHWRGGAGTERRAASVLSYTQDNDFGYAVKAVMELSFHRVMRDDPLAIMLRLERLEKHLERAERDGTNFVTETSPYCSENLCLQPVFARGLCSKHYHRERQHWDTGICSVDGCTKGARSAGMCSTHYQRERQSRPDAPRCKVDGCDKAISSRGYCHAHYTRQRRLHAEEWAAERAAERAAKPTQCTVTDCGKGGRLRKGLCEAHYRSELKRKRGTPR